MGFKVTRTGVCHARRQSVGRLQRPSANRGFSSIRMDTAKKVQDDTCTFFAGDL